MRRSGIFHYLAVILVLLLSPSLSAADFDSASDAWNGLSDFTKVASDRGVELHESDRLDWADVSVGDVLIVIYPEQILDVESLSSFVIDGGHLVIFDDFGLSDGFLGRLSLARPQPSPDDLPHHTFVNDERDWPLFRPTGRHPLLTGVQEIVANHPSVLENMGGAVVAFDEGGGLIYDMLLGEGRAIVVSDSSIVTNSMLAVADNRRLIENTLDYACRQEAQGCRAWLLVARFETIGRYGVRGDNYFNAADVQERVQTLNEEIFEAFSRLQNTDLLYFLAIFLVLGSAGYLATVFPWQRGEALSRFMAKRREECSPPLTEFDWNVARYSEARKGINFVLPLAILKENFEELFLAEFGLWPSQSGQRPSVTELARRFDERFLRGLTPKKRQKRRAEVQALLSELTQVPTRHRVFLDSDERFRARDLRRIHGQVRRVLGWMGLQEEYERRKRETGHRGTSAARGGEENPRRNA